MIENGKPYLDNYRMFHSFLYFMLWPDGIRSWGGNGKVLTQQPQETQYFLTNFQHLTISNKTKSLKDCKDFLPFLQKYEHLFYRKYYTKYLTINRRMQLWHVNHTTDQNWDGKIDFSNDRSTNMKEL